ncbi:MAG TPA: DUF6542 domain-containing protein [Trebonia sp.]|nr:DUF6542 domain-containing protein [Trebonia sp.]
MIGWLPAPSSARHGAPRAPVRLSGRDGVLAVFGACLTGLLVADLAHWGELADAVFFQASTLTAYYVRPGSLLPVVVSPPVLFLAACAAASAVTSPGMADGSVAGTLARAAWWLLAGMALTVAIGLLRGLRAEVLALWCSCGYSLTCAAREAAGRSSSP